MRKIKPKLFQPKLPKNPNILFVQDAATYYSLCLRRDEQIKLADFAQRFFENLRRIFYPDD